MGVSGQATNRRGVDTFPDNYDDHLYHWEEEELDELRGTGLDIHIRNTRGNVKQLYEEFKSLFYMVWLKILVRNPTKTLTVVSWEPDIRERIRMGLSQCGVSLDSCVHSRGKGRVSAYALLGSITS